MKNQFHPLFGHFKKKSARLKLWIVSRANMGFWCHVCTTLWISLICDNEVRSKTMQREKAQSRPTYCIFGKLYAMHWWYDYMKCFSSIKKFISLTYPNIQSNAYIYIYIYIYITLQGARATIKWIWRVDCMTKHIVVDPL